MTHRKLLGWVLFASLGLNVFLAGAWASQLFCRGPDRRVHIEPSVRTTDDTPNGMRSPENRTTTSPHRQARMATKGPPTLRMSRAVAQVMGGRNDARVKKILERGIAREEWQRIHTAHERVEQALLAEPFDLAALRAAFVELSEQTSAAQTTAQEHVLALAEKMTPEERAALRSRLAREAGAERRKGPGAGRGQTTRPPLRQKKSSP